MITIFFILYTLLVSLESQYYQLLPCFKPGALFKFSSVTITFLFMGLRLLPHQEYVDYIETLRSIIQLGQKSLVTLKESNLKNISSICNYRAHPLLSFSLHFLDIFFAYSVMRNCRACRAKVTDVHVSMYRAHKRISDFASFVNDTILRVIKPPVVIMSGKPLPLACPSYCAR